MAQIQPREDRDVIENVGKIKKKAAKVADWLNKYWLVKTIILFMPVVWTPLFSKITFINKALYDNNGNLKFSGIVTMIIVFGLSLTINILANVKAQRDQQRSDKDNSTMRSLEGTINLWETVSNSESSAEHWRINELQNYGRGIITNQPVNLEKIVQNGLNPQKHIEKIVDEIKRSISSLATVQERQIQISAAISIDAAKWKWLIWPQRAGMATIDELLEHNSAFKQVADGKPYVSYNDKVKAKDAGLYYMDNNDDTAGGIGSIICWEVDGFLNERNGIRMIVSISTSGKRLIEDDYANNEKLVDIFYNERVRHNILEMFENELIEDLLLYRLVY